MPLRRFHSVADMPDENWNEPGSPELLEAIRTTWARAERLAPKRFPPGVYRHRSVVDAQKLKEEWARRNFEQHWRRLRKSSFSARPEEKG